MRCHVDSKDLPTAHRWESLRSAYYRQHGMKQEADQLQALADFYRRKICTSTEQKTQSQKQDLEY